MLLLESSTPSKHDSVSSNQNHFRSLGCKLHVSNSLVRETSLVRWLLCLVPRPHNPARPKRFGSRGPSENVRPRLACVASVSVLVSEQRKIEERDFRFWPREK